MARAMNARCSSINYGLGILVEDAGFEKDFKLTSK
jgi:hypothetical protein